MTDDLEEFLRARLDEDERYLNSNRHHLWTQRPLWEVAAKRSILAAWHDNESERPSDDAASYTDGLADGLWLAARYLVTAYADHPDYLQKWALDAP